jgi:hypothetical protein
LSDFEVFLCLTVGEVLINSTGFGDDTFNALIVALIFEGTFPTFGIAPQHIALKGIAAPVKTGIEHIGIFFVVEFIENQTNLILRPTCGFQLQIPGKAGEILRRVPMQVLQTKQGF